MKAIGGYFELELKNGEHYHKDAILLNTARNCLEYILLARKYRKLFIPYYTCEAVLQPLKKLNIEYEYYSINLLLEPIELPSLLNDEAFLYTNYFGLKQNYVQSLASIYGANLIIDNSQAFYAQHIEGVDTFYSPRKFFGVADGGYLYTDCVLNIDIQQDESYDRMKHLLQRIDVGAERGYKAFREDDDSLDNRPILKMSKLTERILRSIDYENIRMIRKNNYAYLNHVLSASNLLSFHCHNADTPMVYPFMSGDKNLKKRLIENKIFVATYWPNVLKWCDNKSMEYLLAESVVCLPIDQRYSELELKIITNYIMKR